ncbi:MAG: hypothetical protein RMJ48_19245 [Roseiflexaceae bacterium]|nr:hypothetical protein [Roseiflexaceae bacterium]
MSPYQSYDHIRDYIIAREQALDRIILSNPGGSVEVSISFRDYTPLNEVWRMKRAYHLDIDQMTLHLFVDGKRHSVLFVGDPVEPDDRRIVDFDAPVNQVEAQLWSLLPAPALEQQGIHPHNTSFHVSWLRGSLATADASLLKDHPAIMLVDPISDILDRYRDRAVDVRVVQAPNLLSAVETVKSSCGATFATASAYASTAQGGQVMRTHRTIYSRPSRTIAVLASMLAVNAS